MVGGRTHYNPPPTSITTTLDGSMAGTEEQENAGTRDVSMSAQASASVTATSERTHREQSTPFLRGRDRAECATRREASRDRLESSKAENE